MASKAGVSQSVSFFLFSFVFLFLFVVLLLLLFWGAQITYHLYKGRVGILCVFLVLLLFVSVGFFWVFLLFFVGVGGLGGGGGLQNDGYRPYQ